MNAMSTIALTDVLNSIPLVTLSIASLIALLLSLVAIVLLVKAKQKIAEVTATAQTQANASELLIDNLMAQLSSLDKKVNDIISQNDSRLIELEQVTHQLEHRIKVVTTECETQKNNLLSLQQQQPEDRLYTRALKLVKLGASVDEIVKECDLPYAEAEILLAIHNKS